MARTGVFEVPTQTDLNVAAELDNFHPKSKVGAKEEHAWSVQ
jgi:hypothetical protein